MCRAFSGMLFIPISVASQSGFCQGKMAMDGHFSFDKPGRRIKTALKQKSL
jgi:hypothetical protein